MPLRTADEYRTGLEDGRTIFYRGQRVANVNEVPALRVAVDHAAHDFDLVDDPAFRELAVVTDPDTGQEHSTYYKIPRDADDLLQRMRLIDASTAEGGTVVTLIKEIGTDATFALLRKLQGEARQKALAFHEHCRDNDLAVAVAQTDVKGDRSVGPGKQADPDLYVRVVEENADGIVVRGAKCHTTSSANADELIVLPTRAMGPGDEDYAVAFAVPIDTPGLELYVSSYSGREHNEFEFPLSSGHKLLESLTVFNDVFVPWDRVFLCREPELAGTVALTFVEYHRFTAVSYKLPLLDAFVGGAALMADLNGVAKAGHIRDKLTHLIAYSENVRALTEMAALRARVEEGIAYPDPLTTNLAKFTFASGYHQALEWVQDCAGGLLVTAPGGDDWASDEVRPVLEKYFKAAKGSAEDRLRLMHVISDLTARDLGGYHAVLAVHAEGSIEAEKMQILRAFDPTRAYAYTRKIAGIEG